MSPSIGPMAVRRDELFCRIAIRQGILNKEEAIALLKQYRSDSGTGMGFGEYLAHEGVIEAAIAAQIDSAIDRREGTEVVDTRRRLPTRGGSPKAQGRRVPGGRGRRTTTSASLAANPMQSTIYIGSGVIALGLLIFLTFQFQKEPTRTEVAPEVTNSNATTAKAEDKKISSETLPPAPAWTPEELRRMESEFDMLIGDVTKTAIEGRFADAITSLKNKREQLGGDRIPAEMGAKFDKEIQDLQQTIDEIYPDYLEELRKAKSENKENLILDILEKIENSCGAEYRKRAENETA